MSFFNSTPPTTYKAQVRVEGFHLPSPETPPGGSSATSNNGGSTAGTNGSAMNDMFPTHSFLPDPFRKFSGGSGEDFNDDLVSLMRDRTSANPHTAGGGGTNGAASSGAGAGGYDEGYHRTTHNIFDVSSPISVNNPAANAAPGSQPSSLHSPSTSLHDYHNHPPPHFNSTLPALNSSMRYEPPPENNPLTPSSPQVPPSSYHNGFTRHTPSPIHSQQGGVNGGNRNERSRSRPPSSAGVPTSALNTGGIGPARTTRTRRGSSMSGTSPPPLQARPHAIMIPGGGHRNSHSGVVGGGPMSAGAAANANGTQWYIGQSQNSDYLPTPESLGSHSLHSHHHSHSSGYGPFSLSPPQGSGTPGDHLPPLQHHMAQSLPKSPMEQHHVPHHHHQHHHSLSSSGLPKSPLDHPPAYGSSYGFSNMNGGAGSGGSPPGGAPGSLPNGNGGMATLVSHGPITGGLTPTGSSYGMSTIAMNMGLPGSAPGGNGVSPPSLGSSGVGNAVGGGAAAAPTSAVGQDKQALLANEKRRRRRESHNAVERRRRDNINEKISELATLIPECMLDGTAPPNAKDPGTSVTPPITEDALVPKTVREKPAANASGSDDGGALKQEKDDDGTSLLGSDGQVVKANKGMILRKSVEYIRYLQQLVTAQGARNRELEQQLRKFRGQSVSSDSQSENTGDGSGNADDAFDNDDTMSIGMGGGFDGEMVLHDEAMATPNANDSSSSSPQSKTPTGAPTKPRKGHHKHSSSTSRPKPSRLPSMPEEELDMEVDKSHLGDAGVDTGSDNPASSERGRTRGVRGSKEGSVVVEGQDEQHAEGQLHGGHQDHEMGSMEGMFGMMNGHGGHGHGHHQQYQPHNQQHVMSW